MNRLRETQIPVLPVALALVVVAGIAAYLAFIKPSADAERIKREWATPEAAAQRGPGRQFSPSYQAAVQGLLSKENRPALTRHRDRE